MASLHEATPLPSDIWLQLIEYLDPRDVMALSQVGRHGLDLLAPIEAELYPRFLESFTVSSQSGVFGSPSCV